MIWLFSGKILRSLRRSNHATSMRAEDEAARDPREGDPSISIASMAPPPGPIASPSSDAVGAIPSGIGVVLAIAGGGANALVGVAIAAALLPPVANCGLCFISRQGLSHVIEHQR